MKFCLVTDNLSPHEVPLARQLAKKLGNQSFCYIVKETTEMDRKSLGWDVEEYPWCLVIGGAESKAVVAERWIQEADAVLFGNRNHPLIPWRLKHSKLTLYSSERWLKPPVGFLRLAHFSFFALVLKYWGWSRSEAFHFLALGLHAFSDMDRLGLFPCKKRLFGYFVDPAENSGTPRRRQGPLKILWVGRMLHWKRVDTLIRTIGVLIKEGRDIRLKLVGQGPEEHRLKKLSETINCQQPTMGDGQNQQSVVSTGTTKGLKKSCTNTLPITFHPPVPIHEVRKYMREADVYVLPSNGREGWGVVLNEAMLEGCAVIAARQTGSGATLIRQGENGLLFSAGSVRELAASLGRLESDEELRLRLAKAGQESVLREWIPSVAAERLVAFCEACLLNGEPPNWPSGPLSVV